MSQQENNLKMALIFGIVALFGVFSFSIIYLYILMVQELSKL